MLIKLQIEGIKCEGCINRIKNVLTENFKMTDFDLSPETNVLSLKVKKEKEGFKIAQKIEDLGFQVTIIKE
jgi:copper chaperone CopZ